MTRQEKMGAALRDELQSLSECRDFVADIAGGLALTAHSIEHAKELRAQTIASVETIDAALSEDRVVAEPALSVTVKSLMDHYGFSELEAKGLLAKKEIYRAGWQNGWNDRDISDSAPSGEAVRTCSHPGDKRMGTGSVSSDGSGHMEWTCSVCGHHERTEWPAKALTAPGASVGQNSSDVVACRNSSEASRQLSAEPEPTPSDPTPQDAKADPFYNARVSIDVSTCDDDATHRVFGRVVEWQPGADGLPHLLCEYDSDNFGLRTLPPSASKPVTVEEIARPESEYHEDMGNVLWWKFPITEPPYVGTPNDLGQTVEVTLRAYGVDKLMRANVGGWPGYHTHFSPLPSLINARTSGVE